jgi:hypothetical protein
MRLYSYCLRYDDGAAPNPYWGTCTLAICKPAIRRTANVGDWVVGLGSKNSPVGDISGHVVYAMRVTRRLAMRDYDDYCHSALPAKIPDWRHGDFRRRVGDCIYDFSSGATPTVRDSVHTDANRERDLGGVNVLLSDHFYYFGNNSERLPDHLLPIVHQTQGHKSHANEEFAHPFVQWIDGLGIVPASLCGEPQMKHMILAMTPDECRSLCSKHDEEVDRNDGIC